MSVPPRSTCTSVASSPSQNDRISACLPVEKDNTGSPDPHFLETLRSSAFSTAAGTSRAMPEFEAADLENRLRDFTLQLVTPVIQRQSVLELEMQDLRGTLQQSSLQVKECSHMAEKVQEQVVMVQSVRQDLATWEVKVCETQAQAAENAARLRQELDAVREFQQCTNTAMHGMQRTLDRTIGELARLQKATDLLRQHGDQRLDQSRQFLSDMTTNLECKIMDLELKYNRSTDEIFELRSGCTSVMRCMESNHQAVASLTKEMQRVQHDKAAVQQLEALQEEVNIMVSNADSNVTTMHKTMDNIVDQMKSHFEKATHVVAVNTDKMLAELRISCQEETSKSSNLRCEVTSFVKQMEVSMQELESGTRLSEEERKDDVRKVSSDFAHFENSQKHKQHNQDLSIQSTKEQVASLRTLVDSLSSRLQSVIGIMSTLLQCESASSALDVQDCSDRANVALLGYGESAKPAGHSHSRPTNVGKDSQGVAGTLVTTEASHLQSDSKSGNGKKAAPVMTVDNRCLSCSAHKQQVIAAFKVACLQYAPGSVHFCDKLFLRQDLLNWRQQLLESAQEQLQICLRSTRPDSAAVRRPSRSREVGSASRAPPRLSRPTQSEPPGLDSLHLESQHPATHLFGSPRASPDVLPALAPR